MPSLSPNLNSACCKIWALQESFQTNVSWMSLHLGFSLTAWLSMGIPTLLHFLISWKPQSENALLPFFHYQYMTHSMASSTSNSLGSLLWLSPSKESSPSSGLHWQSPNHHQLSKNRPLPSPLWSPLTYQMSGLQELDCKRQEHKSS